MNNRTESNRNKTAKIIGWCALIILCVIVVSIRTTLGARHTLFGASADTVLIFTAVVSLFAGEKKGAVCGLVCGTLLACIGGIGVCVQPVYYTAVGYFYGIITRETLSWDGISPIQPGLAAALLLVSRAVITTFEMILNANGFNILTIFLNVLLPEFLITSIYTVVIAAIIYGVGFIKTKIKKKHI